MTEKCRIKNTIDPFHYGIWLKKDLRIISVNVDAFSYWAISRKSFTEQISQRMQSNNGHL